MWESQMRRMGGECLGGVERMQGVRAMSEILHQTDKLNPGDECSVDGRIILHNKRFIIDSWSQPRQHSRHIWALGDVSHRRAAGGGGITIVIWQLPYLILTLLLTLVITKPCWPEQPCQGEVWSVIELREAATAWLYYVTKYIGMPTHDTEAKIRMW